MKLSLSVKLIGAAVVATVLVVGVFAYLNFQAQRSDLLAELTQGANQTVETLKSATRYDMLTFRREGVHRIVETVGKQAGVLGIEIFDKKGVVIFSSDPKEEGALVDKQEERCIVCHTDPNPVADLSAAQRTRVREDAKGRRVLSTVSPIYNEPGCWQAACHAHTAEQRVLGVVDISLSLADADARMLASQTRLIVFAVAGMLALSALIWFFIHRVILRPVNSLVDGTRRVAEGKLSHTIPVESDDEMGALARAFNHMTRRITETQTQLYHADKLTSLGHLAASVAHEINNPLTGVLTYSSFLQKRIGDNPEVKKDLDVIVRETTRCREIVRGLLDFGRQTPPRKEVVSLNDVAEQALAVVENQLSLNGVQVARHLAPDLPPVLADFSQMQQVLINLIVNGGDAMKTSGGGTLTVATRVKPSAPQPAQEDGDAKAAAEEPRAVEVSVGDTGTGIATEDLSRLFEPFFSTKGVKGTGLGLAVSWGIIQEHSGSINVKSEEGNGTTFTITLPAADGDISDSDIGALPDELRETFS